MIVSTPTLIRWLGPRRHALYGDLIQALSGVAVVGAWVFVGAILVRLAGQTISDPGRSDFTIFYYTARMVLDGHPPYGELPVHYGVGWSASHLGNLNPPLVAVLMAPLALLSYEGAARFWVFAGYVSVATLVWATGAELGVRWSVRRALVWGAAIIGNIGFLSVAVTGEWTWFLIWPFWLAWRAARREQWVLAGTWLGVCAGIKLFFLLFLVLLALTKRGRALIAMLAAFVATVAAPLIVLPVTWTVEWVQRLQSVGWWWLPINVSWRGVVARTFQVSRDYPASLDLPNLAEPLAVLGVTVIGVLVGLWALRSGADADRIFLVGLLSSLLLSPLGWVYYLPLAFAPFLALAWRGCLANMAWPERVLLSCGLVGYYVPLDWVKHWGGQSWVAAATTGSLYAWSTVLVLAALLWSAWAHQTTADA